MMEKNKSQLQCTSHVATAIICFHTYSILGGIKRFEDFGLSFFHSHFKTDLKK